MKLNLPTKSNKPNVLTKKGLSRTPRSIKNIYAALRLKQIKPLLSDNEFKKQKQLKPSCDVIVTKPFYELQLHTATIDCSNSVQYIMKSLGSISENNRKNAIIYKVEFGFKSIFFKP